MYVTDLLENYTIVIKLYDIPKLIYKVEAHNGEGYYFLLIGEDQIVQRPYEVYKALVRVIERNN